jgi:hypothetical protein
MIQGILRNCDLYLASEEIRCFYGTKIFVTLFTKARHWTLSSPTTLRYMSA